jgi:ubiquinone/menaquinone biosynthesis C-methylase UbiE
MSGPDTASRFDAWASTYEHSVLQPTLYVPAQQRALQLARQLMPQPQRVLDVGCGTGRLLRQARQQYPSAMLVGIDIAWGMVATAAAVTPAELAIRHVRAAAEQLPFADQTFDLVVVTMSLRHWTAPAAGIAQIARVLVLGGMLVVADVFRTRQRRGLHVAAPWRRGRSDSGAPAELAAVLIANGLVVVGCDRMPWFRLPDIHVIAAQKPLGPYLDDPRREASNGASSALQKAHCWTAAAR